MGLNWERLYRQLENDLKYILMSAADQMEALESALREAEKISISCLEARAKGSALSVVSVARGADLEYSFALYGPERFRLVTAYASSNSHTFSVDRSGSFRVWAHVRSRIDPSQVVVKKSPAISINDKMLKKEVGR